MSTGYQFLTHKSGPKETSSTATVANMQSKPPSDSKRPNPAPVKANPYGIAAGGGLTYVGDKELSVYFSKLKALGVGWARWDLDWGQIQHNDSVTYNWEVADRVVKAANNYGIKSLVIIDYTPQWARKPECAAQGEACPPSSNALFASFASKAAARYKDQGVHDWEIWNEPNYVQSWRPKPDIAAYASLLKDTYIEIKKVDPSANVVSGGLAAIGDEEGHIAPITFVRGLYDQGVGQYFDNVAVHPYSFPAQPALVADWNRWQQIAPIHDVMTQHGGVGKKIWLTEFGAPTGGSGVAHTSTEGGFIYETDYMTEASQASILANALSLYSQYSPWVGPFFFYTLQDHTNTQSSPQDFFGLLRANDTKKPAYDTYQNFIKNN